MSKFLFCNSHDKLQENINRSADLGFSVDTKSTTTNSGYVSYKKLNIDNHDHYESEMGKIVIVGSYVYSDKVGDNELQDALSDFSSHKDVAKLKAKLIGNYAVTISLGDETYCFCDGNDVFDVYYHISNEVWSVSNNLMDLVESLPYEAVLNENAVLETVFQYGIIDNQTIFESLFRLKGDEYIYRASDVDLPVIKTTEYQEFSFTENEAFADVISRECLTNAEAIHSKFGNVSLCMTGGLDSRIVLSSYLAAGCSPNLLYGAGNSALTNTNRKDLDIVKLVKDKFTLDLNVMDWSADENFACNWNLLVKKFGMLGGIYSGIPNVHKALSEVKGDTLLDFGYFGEPFRNIKVLSEYKHDVFTSVQFVDDMYINKDIRNHFGEEKFSEFRSYLLKKIETICVRFNLDPNALTKSDFCKIHNEYRKSADTALVNLMNYYCYSINLLSLPSVEEKVKSVPSEEKEGSKLLLKVIRSLKPELLDLPIFSHGKKYSFCRRTLTLKSSRTKLIKQKLRATLVQWGLAKAPSTKKVARKGINDLIKPMLFEIYESDAVCNQLVPRSILEHSDLRRLSKLLFVFRLAAK